MSRTKLANGEVGIVCNAVVSMNHSVRDDLVQRFGGIGDILQPFRPHVLDLLDLLDRHLDSFLI